MLLIGKIKEEWGGGGNLLQMVMVLKNFSFSNRVDSKVNEYLRIIPLTMLPIALPILFAGVAITIPN